MDIRNKLYPYPVLAPFTDDYKQSSTIHVEIETSTGEASLFLRFLVSLANHELETLILEGAAHIVFHIECPQTAFRITVESQELIFSHSIPREKIRGRVEVCPFIVAKKLIVKYRNLDFSPEYGDAAFDIEPGCILAIGSQFVIDIWTENNDLADIPSVFSVVKSSDPNASHMVVDAESGNKIRIILPEHTFYNYKALNRDISTRPLLLSLLIIPALMSALEMLAKRRDERMDFDQFAWYKAINKKLKIINSPQIEDNDFLDLPMVVVAQKLIGEPLEKAFKVLATVISEEEDL